MTTFNSIALVPAILALQFVAFGWRISREIPVGDQGRKTWFPIPDVINIVSMLAVVVLCVVVPLRAASFGRPSRIALAAAFVLIAFHPIELVGHYRLFSKHGRHFYTDKDRDYPYCTRAEALLVLAGLLLASGAGWYVS